jgi:hypothetical protein
MSDRPSDPAELPADAPQGGVFGNLPDARPGGRSPRRDGGTKPRKTAAAKAAKPAAKQRPSKPRTRPQAKPRPEPARRAPEPAAPEAESGGGLEDMAWAGVATIAEAATVGIRLVNKTFEALRGNSEKR